MKKWLGVFLVVLAVVALAVPALAQATLDKIKQSGVLTAEMSRNQTLNTQLLTSQAVARDSMKLSHEITALYLSSFKDQGLITRLLTLPANVVRDAASLSIVNSSDRKKVEEQLVARMAQIEKRLGELHAQAPQAAASGSTSSPPPAPATAAPTRPQAQTPPAK